MTSCAMLEKSLFYKKILWFVKFFEDGYCLECTVVALEVPRACNKV